MDSNNENNENTNPDQIRAAQPDASQSSSWTQFGQRPLPRRDFQDIDDEQEDGPWGRKTVISLDGGGVRGYSSLLILQRLMEKIKEQETINGQATSSSDYPWMDRKKAQTSGTFLPCHYFDYFAGTSTGGLSAIMLGRLHMSVEEALDQYTEFGNAVFGKPRWLHERSLLWYPRAKYPSRKARGAFQKIIYTRLHQQDSSVTKYQAEMEPFKSHQKSTRTMVFSFCIEKHGGVSVPCLWRSYDHQGHTRKLSTTTSWKPMTPSPGNVEPIWQVARATSAAPRYFESIKINGKKHLDGGMFANNPSLFALKEVRQKHGRPPALFLSIGTGKRNDNSTAEPPSVRLRDFAYTERIDDQRRKQFLKKYLEIGKHWKNSMTDTEGELGTSGWIGFCEAIGLKERHRLNVDENIAEIPLDDWRPSNTGQATLAKITEATEIYLNGNDIQKTLDHVAKELVRIRRKRAETERWEEFALDVTYRCPGEECQSSEAPEYKTRDRLRRHIMNKHTGLSEEQSQVYLDSGRRGNSW